MFTGICKIILGVTPWKEAWKTRSQITEMLSNSCWKQYHCIGRQSEEISDFRLRGLLEMNAPIITCVIDGRWRSSHDSWKRWKNCAAFLHILVTLCHSSANSRRTEVIDSLRLMTVVQKLTQNKLSLSNIRDEGWWVCPNTPWKHAAEKEVKVHLFFTSALGGGEQASYIGSAYIYSTKLLCHMLSPY